MPIALAVALASYGTLAHSHNTVISVQDVVRFASIGDPGTLSWKDYNRTLAAFSPDGTQVAVVLRRGNPQQATNDGSLLVYRTADLLRETSPRTVAEFSSASNSQPIALVRWSSDNETMMFAASRGEQPPQVFSANVRTGMVSQLTHGVQQLLWYDATPTGDWLVTVSEAPVQRAAREDPHCKRSGCLITANTLLEAERGRVFGSTMVSIQNLRTGQVKAIDNPQAMDAAIDFCEPILAGGISPNGRFAIRHCKLHIDDLPVWWQAYTINPNLPLALRLGERNMVRRAVLVDFEKGQSTAISDAPTLPSFMSTDPIWIDDGRYAILAGALESLTGMDELERARRSTAFAVLLLDPATGRMQRIARLKPLAARVSGASWDPKAQLLTVETQDARQSSLPTVYFRRQGSRWTPLSADVKANASLATKPSVRLAIEQTINDPPVLVAADRASGARRLVLDPNPWLKERDIGQVETIAWKVNDEVVWHGGIYYPPHFIPGKRYPLLIQTHGFDPDEFSLHGASRNFPGQALAAHDIVVLQVAERFGKLESTPAEWPISQLGYERAIDHLDRLGLIDPNRVGIQGWSRTGNNLGYALTHSKYSFAAVALTNSGAYGWWSYLAEGTPTSYDSFYGAAPFGEGLKTWIECSPTFNLERFQAPLLLWEERDAFWGAWDWYAGLRRLGKPVEYWAFPDGMHDVFQVSQRLQGNQLVVDWFRFWLKDEERSEVVPWGAEAFASLSDQYARWRAMRKRQDEMLMQPRPPLLKWKATPLT